MRADKKYNNIYYTLFTDNLKITFYKDKWQMNTQKLIVKHYFV